jgi:hypothetical protein
MPGRITASVLAAMLLADMIAVFPIHAQELGKTKSKAATQHEIVMLLIKKKEYDKAVAEANKIFDKINGGQVPDVKFFHVDWIKIGSRRVPALRHGMAGAPGLEVWPAYRYAHSVFNWLIKTGDHLVILPDLDRITVQKVTHRNISGLEFQDRSVIIQHHGVSAGCRNRAGTQKE